MECPRQRHDHHDRDEHSRGDVPSGRRITGRANGTRATAITHRPRISQVTDLHGVVCPARFMTRPPAAGRQLDAGLADDNHRSGHHSHRPRIRPLLEAGVPRRRGQVLHDLLRGHHLQLILGLSCPPDPGARRSPGGRRSGRVRAGRLGEGTIAGGCRGGGRQPRPAVSSSFLISLAPSKDDALLGRRPGGASLCHGLLVLS